MSVQIQVRRGTAAAWTSANPTLSGGELGFETDTGLFKIGDGATAWASLAYAGGGVSDGDKGDITVSGSGGVWTIDNSSVSFAKIQNVSATDKLLGRSTAGAGVIEEIALTAAGRALIDDADAAAQRATLALVPGTDVQAYDADLAAIAALSPSNDDVVQRKAGAWTNRTIAQLKTDLALTHSIQFVMDGGGAVLTTGIKGDLQIDFACTIVSATLLADQSGSIVVNVWKDTYANFPPTVADKITASAPPTLSSATKSTDSTLTGWTLAIAAGDTLRFNIDSVTTITRATLILKVTRS